MASARGVVASMALLLASVCTDSAEAQKPKSGITVEAYMKMDGRGQTMYMAGLIEGYIAATVDARIAIAHDQGRPDKEVTAEILACRWDNIGSIKAYIEAALYRLPREEWDSRLVSYESLTPLGERFLAGCPWGKK